MQIQPRALAGALSAMKTGEFEQLRARLAASPVVADPDVGVLICPITGAFPPMSDRLAQDIVDVAETTDTPELAEFRVKVRAFLEEHTVALRGQLLLPVLGTPIDVLRIFRHLQLLPAGASGSAPGGPGVLLVTSYRFTSPESAIARFLAGLE